MEGDVLFRVRGEKQHRFAGPRCRLFHQDKQAVPDRKTPENKGFAIV
jgi:hypothetical protein